MTQSKHTMSSRFISVALALIIIMFSIPIAFAATPVALSASNVSEWPTTSFVNGEGMYFGQTVGEAVTLIGGTVEYNGAVVPGHFEFLDPNAMATSGNVNVRADLKFVPDDQTSYTGFESKRNRNVTYYVTAVTPVYVDEENDPLLASKIKSGDTLSLSKLSGGKLTNPYNAEESNINNSTWQWKLPTTVVTESGYYEAKFTVKGYTEMFAQVYVGIEGEYIETSVLELPTVSEMAYDGVTTWADVTLKDGVAVEKDTSTVVDGTFAIGDSWKSKIVESGSYEIDAIFTPTDTETYSTVEFKIPVTVNKGIVKFVDESGNETIPEITIDRVLEVGDDLNGYLRPYLNASCSFNYEETEGYGEKIKPGTHEYTVKTIIDNPNYERYGTLTFKIVLNKEKVNAKVKNVVGGKQIYIEGGDTYHLNGNFDVKYFIDGKEAGTIEGVKFNEKFEVKQDKSGVYTYEIVYNGTEDDYYDITVITEAEDIKLQHQVKVAGQEPITYTYGEKVTVTAPAHEKPYYVFTGWGNSAFAPEEDDGEVVDTITFSMPDEDVELEATYEFSIKAFFEYIFSLIVDFFAKIAEFLQLQKVCDFFAGIFAV